MKAHSSALVKKHHLELHSPSFLFRLDTSRGLRAQHFLNRLTGNVVDLGGGPEVELDLDAADRRLYITGWRGKRADSMRLENRHALDYDDSSWNGNVNPAMFWHSGESRSYWTRTHVFLPADCESMPLKLVLGGLGAYDFRFMRVFVNGRALGSRRVRGFWHEPGEFDLDEIRERLRFGLDNVIALQLAEPMRRTPWLDKCDPGQSRTLSWLFSYPGHFEQYIVVGRAISTPKLTLQRVRILREGHVACELRSDNPPLDVTVSYRWHADEPTLHKSITVTNEGKGTVRLLNVHHGRYQTNAKVTEGGQGFPVYLNEDVFVSLAHPAGWAMGEAGRVQLRQYPGKLLVAGETYECMEAVYGVGGRPAFLQHVRQRMRRVRRRTDKPIAIFESFGGFEIPPPRWLQDWVDEKTIIQSIASLARGQRETGCQFDHYSIEFWSAKDGDFSRPDWRHFPNGFTNISREVKRLGSTLGLWVPFTAGSGWSITANPVVSPARNADPAYVLPRPVPGKLPLLTPTMCYAAEPVKSICRMALRHQISANGVRLLKIDGLAALCGNPQHDHLPGLYSTEAICNATIELLRELDAENPHVMLMLYWGFRSPWWLLHGDTLFEPGLCIEGSHPGDQPMLYVRDSVTQGLDQAQWFCHDVPPLGKDSLGIWWTDWGVYSGMGRERWAEGFVMDMCRGSLLAQLWSDTTYGKAADRRQLAEFIALLRAQPKCFANPRFIGGNPWGDEPYGYSCSDGKRTFLALNNCTWKDRVLPIHADGKDVYCWYPQPARLVGDTTRIALRPFEVVLLEVVAAGHGPSLSREFAPRSMPSRFGEPTRPVPLSMLLLKKVTAGRVPIENETEVRASAPRGPKRVVLVRGRVPASQRGGRLVVAFRFRKGDRTFPLNETGKFFSAQGTLAGRKLASAPVVPHNCHPCPWQAWRITVPASGRASFIELRVTAMLAKEVEIACEGHFIPNA